MSHIEKYINKISKKYNISNTDLIKIWRETINKSNHLDSTIFENHHNRVKKANEIIKLSLNNDEKYFAQSWLNILESKNGNDLLEQIFVEASGRIISKKKHGADSEDGLLECKPFKSKNYNVHISDDTPNSLLRHQNIPYITIGETSENGQIIKWCLYTSYRIFDQSRYSIMYNKLDLDKQNELEKFLPLDIEKRIIILNKMKNLWEKKFYIRSNPLPIKDISTLKNGEFNLWINPLIDNINKEIKKLSINFPNSVLII